MILDEEEVDVAAWLLVGVAGIVCAHTGDALAWGLITFAALMKLIGREVIW